MPRGRDDYGNYVDWSPHFVRNTEDVGAARILQCSTCGETYLSELHYSGEWKGKSAYYEYRTCGDCRIEEDEERVEDVVDMLGKGAA